MVLESDLIARGLGATDTELGIINQAIYRVFIRGENFERLAQLTEWTELTAIPRFNDAGTWTLEAPADTLEISLLTKKGGIIITREVNGVEKTIFSGFVWTEWGYTANSFRASGYSDEALLWTPARPTPALNGPPFSHAYDVRTGIASTIMRQLVDVNIGPSAPAPWKIAALTLAPDPLLGTTITSRTNLDPLLTLLSELAITPYSGGLGFYLRQSDSVANSLEFGVYAPEDRSADAKFSIELQTAQDYEDFDSAPEANHVYVLGGDDFGISRTIITAQDNPSIAEWGRVISTIIDRRGTTDLSELNQEAAEAIAGALTTKRKAITPFDIPTLQYGVDYDLGTLVTIVTRSGETVDLIRQVEISLDKERGPSITPIVGSGDGSDEERVATIVRTIQNRVSNIERNWTVPDNSLIPAMFHESVRDYVGDLKLTARSAAQPAWLVCDGSAVSRTVYSSLFSAIGTIYGAGDGSTTFNLPDFRGRMPIGVGLTYSLGVRGGADTLDVNFGSHSHNHSHGGGNLVFSHTHSSQAHTHPGSHSHGLEAHRHPMSHLHAFEISGLDTGKRNNDSVGALGFEEPNVSSGTEDHHHVVNTYNSDTDVPSVTNTSNGDQTDGGGSFSSTEADTNAPAASYTGSPSGPSGGSSWTGGTEQDTTPTSISTTGLSIKNTYQCINITIFTGVQP